MGAGALGWAYVIFGMVLIGIGGLITTLGWNKVAAQDHKANAMQSLVREVQRNGRMIDSAVELARRWPSRSANESFSHEPYMATHITAVLTSGTLDPSDPRERELLDSLERYEGALSRFNSYQRIVGRLNPGIFIKTDLIHVTDPQGWPATARDALAGPFRELLDAHEKLQALLARRYPSTTTGPSQLVGGERGAA